MPRAAAPLIKLRRPVTNSCWGFVLISVSPAPALYCPFGTALSLDKHADDNFASEPGVHDTACRSEIRVSRGMTSPIEWGKPPSIRVPAAEPVMPRHAGTRRTKSSERHGMSVPCAVNDTRWGAIRYDVPQAGNRARDFRMRRLSAEAGGESRMLWAEARQDWIAALGLV